jgi:hypothetical protein
LLALRIARSISAAYCPANHSGTFPEVVRGETAASYFDATEPFARVVESVDEVDKPMPAEG